jgi:hypothetical protein
MGAELRFQIADIDGSHVPIIADVTMLVICHFSIWKRPCAPDGSYDRR